MRTILCSVKSYVLLQTIVNLFITDLKERMVNWENASFLQNQLFKQQ